MQASSLPERTDPIGKLQQRMLGHAAIVGTGQPRVAAVSTPASSSTREWTR